MVIRRLYEIGLEMMKEPDWPPAMYEERRIRWEVMLTGDGVPEQVISIDPYDRTLGRMQAPDRPSNFAPCLIVDTPEYVLGIGDRGNPRHKAYLDLLSRCVAETRSPRASAVLESLVRHKELLLAELGKHGFGANEGDGAPSKASEWINFMVDGTSVVDEPEIRAWWAEFARDEIDGAELCGISGRHAPVTRRFPVAVGIGGKRCRPASVDSPACKSYGYDKSDHAPMSHDAALIAGTALKVLLSDPQSHRRIGDVEAVFWTRDRRVRDAISLLGFGGDEAVHAAQVAALFQGVFLGREYYPPDDQFCTLLLTNTESRVVVRASLEAALPEVVRSVRDWFDSIALCGPGRRNTTPRAIHEALQSSGSRQSRRLSLALVRKAFFGVPLDQVAYCSILASVRSSILRGGASRRTGWGGLRREQVQAIKVYLSQTRREVRDLVELDENYHDVAYQYGRLMAVYEAVQHGASCVQRTVTERFFSSMMQNPTRTVAKLDSLARSHLLKGGRIHGQGWRVYQSRRLQDINQAIPYPDAVACDHMSLEQRGMFVLGYWHEKFRTYESRLERGVKDGAGPIDHGQDIGGQ